VSDSARAGASGADRTRRPAPRPRGKGKAEELGPFARLARFVRQVIAELKKVVRPSRKDLVGYATAVLVFVAAVMAFVTLVDLGVGSLTRIVFGG
jgi:preprotein translocase subunit SecE